MVANTPHHSPVPDSALGQMLRGDPLARLLRRVRIHPIGFGLIVLAYGLLHALLLPAVLGHLRTARGVVGALDDWPYLVIMLGAVPLLAGYYAWQPSTIQAVYTGIAERAGNNPAAAARVVELARPLGWRGWSWIALAVGGFQVVSWINDLRRVTIPLWLTVNGLMIGSAQPLRFLGFYVIVFILVRQIATLVNLNRFFAEFAVEIAPLHPDRAGGLRVLGDYGLSCGFLIAVVGLNLGMTLLRGQTMPDVLTPEYYFELAVYLVAAPVLFFLPLWSVHTRMAVAKQKLLAEIAEQFELEYRSLLDGLRRNELKLDDVARLEAIQKVYKIAQASPAWPFDLEIVSKFGAAVLLPLLLPMSVDVLVNVLMR